MPIDIKKYRELRRKYLWYMARYKKLSDKQSTLSAYAGDDNDKAKDNLKAYISMLMLGMLQMLGMPEINRERLEGAIGNILKPDKLGLEIGKQVLMTIVAPHNESKDGLEFRQLGRCYVHRCRCTTEQPTNKDKREKLVCVKGYNSTTKK